MASPSKFLLLLTLSCLTCLPFISSLSSVSISETSNQTLICALLESSRLNCTSFPTGIQIPSVNRSFSGIVAGDGFQCVLSFPSATIMLCYRFSANGTNMHSKRLYYNDSALTEVAAGNTHVCGLVNGTNILHCWQWRGFNTSVQSDFSGIAVGEGFVCGLSSSGRITCIGTNSSSSSTIRDRVPSGSFQKVAAGFRHACAIYRNQSLVCWGETVGEEPQGEFVSLALGENRSCAMRGNGTVVCWGENGFSLPESLRETVFMTIEAKRSVFCGVDQYNFSLLCWGNEIFDSNSMVFPKVLPGSCTSSECPNGVVPGSGSMCGRGHICNAYQNRTLVEGPSQPPSPPPEVRNRSGWNDKMVAFLVVGCVGSASFLAVICFFLFRYCKGRGCSKVHDSGRLDEAGMPPEHGLSQRQTVQAQRAAPVLEKRLSQLVSLGNGGRLEEFSLQELRQATNDFSQEHRIGTGSFGCVYRATLEDGKEVAIKRAEVSTTSSNAVGTRRQEDKDTAFVSELDSLSRLNHRNLVRLLGYCEDYNEKIPAYERILVYEYMNNGTLHDHLHKLHSSPLMSWTNRLRVALDAARGIEYLHMYAVPQIIHRDIKSSNILLDASLTAKVSDFGLSLMGPEDEDSHLSLHAAGTVGYMDPEYYRLQQLTPKSDVYSFGVLLLELLSGHKAIHKNENGVPRNVVDLVVPYIVQDEIHRVLDPNVPPPTPYEIEAVTYIGLHSSRLCNARRSKHQNFPGLTATPILDDLALTMQISKGNFNLH
uniref:Protein kinase domain-containing protein n=1 Tax=Vitis vinifera TaxID=29760 RepID=A5BXC2_VITVI|nr:hypothetical protein VITISV_029649 [Vitis vinifera]